MIYQITNKSSETEEISPNDKVNVDYKMEVYSRKKDGTEELKEVDKGEKVDFSVSNLISGLVEGLTYLHKGDSAIFYIKPELGYGSFPQSPNIPVDATLVFTVSINDLKKAEVPSTPEVEKEVTSQPETETSK